MATLIRMPEVAANTDSAVIVAWSKQEGDTVESGDCLAEIETEKAVIEFSAEQSGVLGKILVQAGKEVEVGTPIAALFAPGEKGVDIAALLSESSDQVRSEEHTSELQSLMRISYAVFCLKKKKNKTGRRKTTLHKHGSPWRQTTPTQT